MKNDDIFKLNSDQMLNFGIVDDCLIVSFLGTNKSDLDFQKLENDLFFLFDSLKRLNFNKWIIDVSNISIMYNDIAELIKILEMFSENNLAFIVSDKEQKEKLKIDRFGAPIINLEIGYPNFNIPMEFYSILSYYITGEKEYNSTLSNFKINNLNSNNQSILKKARNRFKNEMSNCDDLKGRPSLIHQMGSTHTTSMYDDIHQEVFYDTSEKLLNKKINSLYDSSLQSPLLDLVLIPINGKVKCKVYHSGALYKTKSDDRQIFLSKPSRLAEKTNLILGNKIKEFENLINDPQVPEWKIQSFLEANPNFLLRSDYSKLYPQVILKRQNSKNLIPDFFLQPSGASKLLDILELKLPTEKIIVGKKGDRRMSSKVKDAVSQLKRYERYFEEKKHRDKVYETLGMKCYKPNLLLVIGRYSPMLDSPDVRNTLSSSYSDVDIMTYDDLLEHAKSRLLI